VATKDTDALAAMFQDKAKLRQDAKQAAKDAGGSDEFAEFFGSLDDTEIETLAKTHDELSRLGLKGKSDKGATVTFL
jgi:hypothetical protein